MKGFGAIESKRRVLEQKRTTAMAVLSKCKELHEHALEDLISASLMEMSTDLALQAFERDYPNPKCEDCELAIQDCDCEVKHAKA